MYTLSLNDDQMEIVSRALLWYQTSIDSESKNTPNRAKAKVLASQVEDIYKTRIALGMTTKNGKAVEFSGWHKKALEDVFEAEKEYAEKEGF